MNEAPKKRKVTIIVLVLLSLFIIVGASYALWQITLRQTNQNTITTSCFKIDFNDENPINLQEALPITDEVGKTLVPYQFTLTNTCNSYANFQVNLEVLDNTNMENLDYIKVQYEEETPKLLTSNEAVEKTLNNAKISYKLETGYLDKNEEVTLHLRLWLDEATPTTEEMMNKIFESKVTVITTYEKDFDKEKPTVNFQTTKEENKVVIDASKSEDNTSIKYYYYSKDGENYIKSKNDHYTFINQDIKYTKAVEALIELEKNTINEVFVKVEDEYGNMSEVKSEIVGDMVYDKTADNNLRYVGDSPANYVNFNKEKWRIIGVMNNIEDKDGNKEARIKLVKDESIGEFASDASASNLNNGWGVNEWSQTKLKTLLNDYYYNSLSFTYKCAILGTDSTLARDCSFNGNGLKEDSKKYIEDVVWHTGANATPLNDNDMNTRNINVHQFYEQERSENTGKRCTSGYFCTDNVKRTTKWTGKIGVIYPSDFGYATLGSDEKKRDVCLEEALMYTARTLEENLCMKKNYLNRNISQWTMMPAAHNITNIQEFRIVEDGYVERTMQGFRMNVYPALYLKTNTNIISGKGTKEDSFELSLGTNNF